MKDQVKNYGKRPLWQWILIYVIAAIVIYGVVYYFFFAQTNTSKISPTTNTTTQQIKFSDTPEFSSAYLISTANYDAKTKTALAGFKVDRQVLADGTQQINLTAQNTEYQNQSYTVKPGQSLYFIEKFLQDDANGQEKNLGDDKAVLVDANGYVVQ